jgi:hypothetical protein
VYSFYVDLLLTLKILCDERVVYQQLSLSDSQQSTYADKRDFDETKAAAPSKREVITFAQA